jgi:surface antigen
MVDRGRAPAILFDQSIRIPPPAESIRRRKLFMYALNINLKVFGKRLSALALAGALLAGCADAQNNPKQTLGTIVGAGLGALAGSQIGGGKGAMAAVAIGALAGAWMGGEVGKSLDKADQAYLARTTQNSLETSKTGVTSSWRNPDSGHHGTVTPTSTYQKASGEYCRQYEQTIYVDGKEETASGRACRQPDGTWKVVS